jgi:hypothetical protein
MIRIGIHLSTSVSARPGCFSNFQKLLAGILAGKKKTRSIEYRSRETLHLPQRSLQVITPEP